MADKPIEQNIFDAIVHRADRVNPGWGGNATIARTVIQTIIYLTPSPRTAAELTRILAQEDRPVVRPVNPSTRDAADC